MRLKLTVVTSVFPIPSQPYRGQALYQTLLALAKNADVNVVCPFPRYPTWFQPTFDHRRPDLSYCPPGMPTQYFEYPALPGVTRYLNGAVCARYLEAYLRESKPDVVCNFWLYPEGFATVAAARRLGVPAVVGSIGSDLHQLTDPVARWLTRLTMRRASFVITKGEYLRRHAIRMGVSAGKIRSIPNGCDPTVFRIGDREAARKTLNVRKSAELILYVGRLETAKGVFELLEAFSSLANRRPSLQLTYVGDGPCAERLRRRVVKLALDNRVHFSGARNSEEVAQWLAASNAFALPSYDEGCPSAVIEALSCGRPVIATHVGGIPDLVTEKSGILVAPRDSVALAGAIEAAITRKWSEQSISQQFRRKWDDAADEMLEVCELAFRQQSLSTRQWQAAD